MPEPEWSLKTLMGHIPLGENTLEMFEVGGGGVPSNPLTHRIEKSRDLALHEARHGFCW